MVPHVMGMTPPLDLSSSSRHLLLPSSLPRAREAGSQGAMPQRMDSQVQGSNSSKHLKRAACVEDHGTPSGTPVRLLFPASCRRLLPQEPRQRQRCAAAVPPGQLLPVPFSARMLAEILWAGDVGCSRGAGRNHRCAGVEQRRAGGGAMAPEERRALARQANRR
ncbi:hypothetical protein PVAP13_8KG067951 [Panicum virgatum]|uniref:Uncharacterized protein n=1 Tax=Panicum virgatum TaxID=38727 RepID=A0A8T0PEG6_PANVG|nr:hypothetical protein PVAP13_8KG067951 [Panicum virgatum]